MRREYKHAFACYGMPINLKVMIETSRAVWKEGKRKRYCRACLASALDGIQAAIVAELKKVGAP